MVVVPVLVACGWLFGGVGGGEGVFLGEVKARRKDIISSSLDYQKQKLSTDKQFIFKPQFTRHAGKAGGFTLIIYNLDILGLLETPQQEKYGKVGR